MAGPISKKLPPINTPLISDSYRMNNIWYQFFRSFAVNYFPSPLTRVDDTNVTLTLGGSPGTAVLQAVSLNLGWTGTLSLDRGGTAAGLTASNGGIVYSTASALNILAGTATSNKMLLSGASTTPSWSTSTIPSSAGATANKVLLSDGINYILSTPTFPNASATSLKYIRSDGTNWIASTSTLPDSYAQGDILYASAANILTALVKNTGSTRYLSNTGTNNNPAWAQIELSTGVSGILPLVNGGTGVTALPKFKAYVGTDQTITNNTNTKVILDTETFDSNSNFDSTTNYRFTPTVAGDYRISASILMTLGAATTKIVWLGIFKNGSEYSRSTIQQTFLANDIYNLTTTDIVSMNGSTDYVEIYTFQNTGASVTVTSGANLSYASGECLLS